MTTKRTTPMLLAVASLLGLFATGCFYPYPDHRHHRHYRLDLNVGAVSATQAETAGR